MREMFAKMFQLVMVLVVLNLVTIGMIIAK